MSGSSPTIIFCEAEGFTRSMGAGRTRPVLLGVRRPDGTLVEAVVKLRANLTEPPLEYLCEWLGAAIGTKLGVSIPDPLAVNISAEFADSVADARVRAEMLGSLGLAFGSAYREGVTQVPAGAKRTPILAAKAELVLGFDVLIHNPDRRIDNNNVFFSRADFLAFDHELAFDMFRVPVIGCDPVTDHGASVVGQHALRQFLRAPEFVEFAARIKTLDQAFFDSVRRSTPVPWVLGPAAGKLSQLLDGVERRCQAAEDWIPKMRAYAR